ncbi:hypothetical protein GPECTOR_1g114 [Gonium pectorale]|uniref:Pre-rRNA-processing protein TSR2 n=1 Tax=Gonium pectorale TaxID=33097 RepID=A0A150H253_GONPE|nr:hypothetical protein GPECTOR_1g114 [Gonium pectorale]|eukprot:KXZ56135.1 hypothetical protein GPECTOR_1g114 [Gonium pectorale]
MQLRNGTVVGQNILPVQGRPLFEEGARLIFAKWTALALAVENQWGGSNSSEKANDLLLDSLDWFYRRKDHDIDDLEDMLNEGISEDFSVQAEDGSPRMVADAMLKLYRELVGGVTTYLEHLRSMAAGVQQSKRQVVDLDGTVVEEDAGMDTSSDEEDDDGDDDDEMDTEGAGGSRAPQAVPLEPPAPRIPIVDEDGFTMAQYGGGSVTL